MLPEVLLPVESRPWAVVVAAMAVAVEGSRLVSDVNVISVPQNSSFSLLDLGLGPVLGPEDLVVVEVVVVEEIVTVVPSCLTVVFGSEEDVLVSSTGVASERDFRAASISFFERLVVLFQS